MTGEEHGAAKELAGPRFADSNIRAVRFAVLDELGDGKRRREVARADGVDDGAVEFGCGLVHVEAFTVDPASAERAFGGEDVPRAEIEQVARDLVDGSIKE